MVVGELEEVDLGSVELHSASKVLRGLGWIEPRFYPIVLDVAQYIAHP